MATEYLRYHSIYRRMIDRFVLLASLPFALTSGAVGLTFAAYPPEDVRRLEMNQSANLASRSKFLNVASGPSGVPSSSPTVIIRANDGLFRTRVDVDGRAVQMIIDTGATNTIMSSAAADRFFPDRLVAVQGTVRTVAGRVDYSVLQVKNLSVGSRNIKNIDIAIVETRDEFALLGQDVLSRIGEIGINGEKLTLP